MQLSCQDSQSSCQCAKRSVRTRKLAPETVLWQIVKTLIRVGWSPEQIAGQRKRINPEDLSKQVSHQTIYAALYALPKGERRKELIESLRPGKQNRRPRRRGNDRRGQIPNMASIHDRPAEVEDRQLPSHWEGDLIKGARNQSALGTLVERQSRYVLMAGMDGADCPLGTSGF
ncbi:MAG: IS30 family transposase [Candidatus Poribacteria bacterium]|nr:IS30 family transposase [Candidatus Poribacteria bacterium]MDP6996821.1 IS30 family transposase [Candidatus Poribacteria bacterium]